MVAPRRALAAAAVAAVAVRVAALAAYMQPAAVVVRGAAVTRCVTSGNRLIELVTLCLRGPPTARVVGSLKCGAGPVPRRPPCLALPFVL